MYLRSLRTVVAGALCLFIGMACRDGRQKGSAQNDTRRASQASVSLEKVATEFIKASNALGMDLYRELGATGERNVAIAPSSVSVVMAMVWMGAHGSTREEMSRTLHLSGDQTQMARSAKTFSLALKGLIGEGLTLRAANGLYVDEGVPLEPDFVATTRQKFGATVESLAFGKDPESARRTINARVAAQTEQRIGEILSKDSLSQESRLVLTNAVYFLGNWLAPFSSADTGPSDFHTNAETVKKVAMMRQESEFGYVAADGLKMLEMPYNGSQLGMVLLLPDETDGLSKLDASLTAERFETWAKGMKKKKVEVVLPRFRLDCAIQLKRPLEKLGMRLAFDRDKADFRGMSARRLFLDDVFHNVFVRVDEKGTEAAAATAGALREASERLDQIRFVADHPFLFAIRHRVSGTLLFLGHVVDPGA